MKYAALRRLFGPGPLCRLFLRVVARPVHQPPLWPAVRSLEELPHRLVYRGRPPNAGVHRLDAVVAGRGHRLCLLSPLSSILSRNKS